MKKYQFIDIIKTFAIFLVVLGHTRGIPKPIFSFIYSFHIPLFFILSGFLYNQNKYKNMDFKEFTKYKFLKYINPYIIYISIFYVLYIVIINYLKFGITDRYFLEAGKNFLGSIYSRGTIEFMPNCSPLWFLTALFSLELVFFTKLKIKNTIMKNLYLISMCCIGIILSFSSYKLPWNIDSALVAVPFFILGYLLKKYELLKNNKFFLIIPLNIFMYYFFFHQNVLVDFDGNRYSNIFNMYLLSFSMCLSILYIFSKLEKVYNSFFEFTAKNTIHIFALDYTANSLIHFINIHYMYLFIIKILILYLFVYFINKFKLT